MLTTLGIFTRSFKAIGKGTPMSYGMHPRLENLAGELTSARAAFYEKKIVLHPEKSQHPFKSILWTTMRDCLKRNFAVESAYPSCSYLFRCLQSPSNDPIATLVATAELISTSSTLSDIIGVFAGISNALEGVSSSQAAGLLKPLRDLPIVPITDGPGRRSFDRLVRLKDTGWFIADLSDLWKSFHGKVPLLAFSIDDLPAPEAMQKALRLGTRLISKSVTRTTTPAGSSTIHRALTESFRAKGAFMKAYVFPCDYPASAPRPGYSQTFKTS